MQGLCFVLTFNIVPDITRNLGTLITCLKTARSSGLISFEKKSLKDLTMESTSLWCGVVPVELMRKALCHLDDQVRPPSSQFTNVIKPTRLTIS